jgi:hypothetical protein
MQVEGPTLSACQATRCTYLPGPGGGPSGRGLHKAEFLKDFTFHKFQAINFDEIL